MSEQRRYVAEMPREAWAHGLAPRERRRKQDAREDLAGGIERYLHGRQGSTEPLGAERYVLDQRRPRGDGTLSEWTAWAARLGAGRPQSETAPDGSTWSVTTRIDYPWT